MELKDDLKVFSFAGQNVLGTQDDNVITGVQINSPDVNANEVAHYLKAREINELSEMTVSEAHGMISSPLTAQTKVIVITEEARFAAAKDQAQGMLNNMAYDRVRQPMKTEVDHGAQMAPNQTINANVQEWKPQYTNLNGRTNDNQTNKHSGTYPVC